MKSVHPVVLCHVLHDVLILIIWSNQRWQIFRPRDNSKQGYDIDVGTPFPLVQLLGQLLYASLAVQTEDQHDVTYLVYNLASIPVH